MGLFSRKKAAAESAPDEANVANEASDAAEQETASSGPERGPWDVADRPDLDGRLDLGALRVRPMPGGQVGFAMNNDRTVVHGVTLRDETSSLFVELFAAPRTLGVWDEVREDIIAALGQQGATADEMDGPFGREIVARQVGRRPDGSTERVPTRLIGIDGPRWFVRATCTGKLAALVGDERELHPLEKALADLVVNRDGAARAPKSRIDLSLPEGVGLNKPGQAGTPAPQRPAPGAPVPSRQRPQVMDADEVLRRGPEITEVR